MKLAHVEAKRRYETERAACRRRVRNRRALNVFAWMAWWGF